MSTPLIADVREALAAAVQQTGLACDPYTRASVNAPQAMVNRSRMNPNLVLGAKTSEYHFRVTIYVNGTDELAAQELLDSYSDLASPASVVNAIEAYNWAGLGVHYGQCDEVGEVLEVTVGELTYLTTAIDVSMVF